MAHIALTRFLDCYGFFTFTDVLYCLKIYYHYLTINFESRYA